MVTLDFVNTEQRATTRIPQVSKSAANKRKQTTISNFRSYGLVIKNLDEMADTLVAEIERDLDDGVHVALGVSWIEYIHDVIESGVPDLYKRDGFTHPLLGPLVERLLKIRWHCDYKPLRADKHWRPTAKGVAAAVGTTPNTVSKYRSPEKTKAVRTRQREQRERERELNKQKEQWAASRSVKIPDDVRKELAVIVGESKVRQAYQFWTDRLGPSAKTVADYWQRNS